MPEPSRRPEHPAHPDRARQVGTLITLAPAASTLSHLLRSAIDAEQVGATRIHLASDQQEIVPVIAGLRRQTDLVITIAPDHPAAELVDRMPADFSEVVLDEGPDDVDLVAEVVRIDRDLGDELLVLLADQYGGRRGTRAELSKKRVIFWSIASSFHICIPPYPPVPLHQRHG